MATTFALRALLGSTLAIGVVDLAWLELSLLPAAVAGADPSGPGPARAAADADGNATPNAHARADADAHAQSAATRGTARAGGPAPTKVAVAPSLLDDATPSRAEVDLAPVERVEVVYFDRMSASISPDGRSVLAQIAKLASRDLVIVGHSDHRGDPDVNRTLRLRRAMAIRDHLAMLGIASDRVHVRAADDGDPVDEAQLWQQRRAEIHFTTGVVP